MLTAEQNVDGLLMGLQALQQLFCARRILGNSYVSAFYFFGNDMFSDEITPEQNDINKSLFEDQQACLETEVSWQIFCCLPTCIGFIQADNPLTPISVDLIQAALL